MSLFEIMKVLVNDPIHEEGISLLEKEAKIDERKRKGEELEEAIGDFDAIIVRRGTDVNEDVVERGASGRLKIIGRAGIGYDNIDTDAASKNGIVVKNAPHGNTNAAAEQALGLMLSVARNTPQAHMSLQNGEWSKKPYRGVELSGKTLGIIGCGRIGQRLSEIVSGLGMDVLGCDLDVEEAKERFPDSRMEYVPQDKLLSQSDFVSIHTGGKSEIIGPREIAKMKEEAFLINVSRGANVNEEELYNALRRGGISGAGLDVHEEEPGEGETFNNRLRGLPNVVMTSHLEASTYEAQEKTGREMARVTLGYLQKGDFGNAVNVDDGVIVEASSGAYPLFVHHEEKSGVYGEIDSVLGDEDINIYQQPSGKFGYGNAVTVFLLGQEPSRDIVKRIDSLDPVYSCKR